MCEFEVGEKAQCVDDSPPSSLLAPLFHVEPLRKGAIYTIHGVLLCPSCGGHWFVKVDPATRYWWEEERFAKLEPPRNELTERICKYLRTPNPEGKPEPEKTPVKVPELEPADALAS